MHETEIPVTVPLFFVHETEIPVSVSLFFAHETEVPATLVILQTESHWYFSHGGTEGTEEKSLRALRAFVGNHFFRESPSFVPVDSISYTLLGIATRSPVQEF